MRALIQRVRAASVKVDGEQVGAIDSGLLLFLGVAKDDDEVAARRLLERVLGYRVFPDAQGRMNHHLLDVQGELLIVSQFTLVADTRKGMRPSFSSAASPELARSLYGYFVEQARLRVAKVAEGRFAADMQVALVNDGPVTFLLET